MILSSREHDPGTLPVCSVCIANYNGAGLLGPCIDSILAQDCDLPIEIIVHDDASTDNSAALIRERFPEVFLMEAADNLGYCASNNRMVDAARGDYVLLVNNDVVLRRDAVGTLYNYAVSQGHQGILSLPQYDAQTGELIDMGRLFDPFLNPVPNLDPQRRDVAMVIGACLWLPRSLYNELGGFPEWFGNIAEDMFLCCLARLRGYPVVALSVSGYDHWVGRSFGGGKVTGNRLQTCFRRRALSERNKSYVMLLYYPAWINLFMFPVHLVLLLAEGIALSALKSDRRILREIYVPCLKSLWSRRKELADLHCTIQKQKVLSSRNIFSCHTPVPYKLKMLLKHGLPSIG